MNNFTLRNLCWSTNTYLNNKNNSYNKVNYDRLYYIASKQIFINTVVSSFKTRKLFFETKWTKTDYYNFSKIIWVIIIIFSFLYLHSSNELWISKQPYEWISLVIIKFNSITHEQRFYILLFSIFFTFLKDKFLHIIFI